MSLMRELDFKRLKQLLREADKRAKEANKRAKREQRRERQVTKDKTCIIRRIYICLLYTSLEATFYLNRQES